MEESCVAKALEADYGCQDKCTGLYVDIWYAEEENKFPDKVDDRDSALLNMLQDGKLLLFLYWSMIFLFSVVKRIPMREKDRATHLSYILKSKIERTSMESDHRRELFAQMEQYEVYKKSYARDIVFDPAEPCLSKLNASLRGRA